MSHAVDSKEAQAYLIDPMNAPEPSSETGPGAHFGSTFAPKAPSTASSSTHQRNTSNPYRNGTPPTKGGASATARASSGSPKERFPDYRADAFSGMDQGSRRRAGSHGTPPSYREATSSNGNTPSGSGRRRGSSLRERYPGDESHKPLDIIRKDSRKAARSPHLKKKSIPGADTIDRLDPAIGGRAYHHEGPYDAAMMSRNRDPKTAPLNALDDSNREALKATPQENIKNAVDRHQPLDGVADVPPGQPDRMGRTYDYEEGTDLMQEGYQGEAGYKRWPGKNYSPEDHAGKSDPTFTLDRALRAHKISDNGNGDIELQDRAHLMSDYDKQRRTGNLDARDPVEIAGDDGKYADMEIANAEASGSGGISRARGESGGLKEGLKKRIGSLRHRRDKSE